MATYKAGTSIAHIVEVDRSQHIYFCCPTHPARKFFSKDPWVSSWFMDKGEGLPVECDIDCPEMILTKDYVL